MLRTKLFIGWALICSACMGANAPEPSGTSVAAPAAPSAEAPPAPPAEGMANLFGSRSADSGGMGGLGLRGGGPGGGGIGAPARPSVASKGKAAPVEAPKPARMVHYNGHLKLRVTTPAETLQRAAEFADAAGGYVEQLTATTVTLRVPVAKFRELFDRLAKLGDVITRSMTAQDVTDQFVAVELRAKTLKASRDRLIQLLARTTKVREKLELLQEIRRLSEEIDQLELSLTTLASLAELSRLTVEAVPHQLELQSAADEPIAAFRFIRELSPFSRSVAFDGECLKLAAPDGMVLLDDPWLCDLWAAESPDGAAIWASEHDNELAGTTEFWVNAIRDRLAREYASAEVSTVGGFQVLRLVDQSDKAYRYLIAVRVNGDDLQLIEVYYPGEEQEKRYAAAVRAVIERGGK